jgi:uncharacterized protein (DUF3084 family)
MADGFWPDGFAVTIVSYEDIVRDGSKPNHKLEDNDHKAVRILERRAETAEQHAQTAKRRAEAIEQRAQTAEQRAQTAEQRAEATEQRAETAERRAEATERRAEATEQRAETAEQRAETAEQRAETAERKFNILKKLLKDVLGMLDREAHAAVLQLINNVVNELRLESREHAANSHASEPSSKLAMIDHLSAHPN